jgi:hypothetical protein
LCWAINICIYHSGTNIYGRVFAGRKLRNAKIQKLPPR